MRPSLWAAAMLFAGTAAAAPVVAVGRRVTIEEPVDGRVISFLGDVHIGAPVSGDVVVWGGDVDLETGGTVTGDLIVFGGTLHVAGEIERHTPAVWGRVLTPGSLAGLYLAEMRKAPWKVDEASLSRTLLGLRLLALAGWVLLSSVLLLACDGALARAARRASEEPLTAMLSGALGVLTLFLAIVAGLSLLPEFLSAPLALLLAGIGVAAKIFGMVALFLVLGQHLMRDRGPTRRPAAAAVGLAVLGGLSLVPVAGPVLWSAASVVGVGVALLSRFGAPRFRVVVA